MPGPSAAISLTAAGPAAVKSWPPILNIPTRSATCLANFSAEDKESKSRATIKLLRGWVSKLNVSGAAPLARAGLGSRPIGYINFASFLVGTAVIDTYQFKFASARVYDADQGTERKMRVRRGESFAV